VARFFPFRHLSRRYCSENTAFLLDADNEEISAGIRRAIYQIAVLKSLPDIWLVDTGFLDLVRNDSVSKYMLNVCLIPVKILEDQKSLAIYQMSVR
jgi:hypothetical protein